MDSLECFHEAFLADCSGRLKPGCSYLGWSRSRLHRPLLTSIVGLFWPIIPGFSLASLAGWFDQRGPLAWVPRLFPGRLSSRLLTSLPDRFRGRFLVFVLPLNVDGRVCGDRARLATPPPIT